MRDLNPGIRRTVEWLRSIGFDTCDSGDGRTHEHPCDRDHAYVVMAVAPLALCTEAERLRRALDARGIRIAPIGDREPCIQASFDPGNGLAFLDLMNVDDERLGPAT